MAQLKKFGVLQTAKFSAAMYFVLTLMMIIPMGLFLLIGGSVSDSKEGVVGAIFGSVLLLLLPFLYALIGFIFIALSCLIYNFVASFIGGIEIEIEE